MKTRDNSKTTKRALFGSFMSLMLCFSMLMGTTFAWFTDTDTTNVNKIVSGNLDVQLVDANGGDLSGKTLTFLSKDGRDEILWEPNATYNLEDIYVKNAGNLALKFKLEINAPERVEGQVNLQDVMEFFVYDGDTLLDLDTAEYYLAPGETSPALTMCGHMEQSAGNEYMNKTLENVSITVYAAQHTSEKDSYSDQYDADAEYGIESEPVTHNSYVTLDNLVIDVDKTAGATDAITVNGGRTIIEGGSYDGGKTPFGGAGNTAVFATAGEVIINDGYFYVDGIAVQEDGTADAGHIDLIYAKGGAQITINGGFFEGADETVWLLNCKDGSGSTITVTGGTFVNWNPAAAQTGAGEIIVNGTVTQATQPNGDIWYIVG